SNSSAAQGKPGSQGRNQEMARINRRRFLKITTSGTVAGKLGGIAAILASGQAPSYAQGTSLHWLRWSDYVPAADQMLSSLLPEHEKALGLKFKFDASISMTCSRVSRPPSRQPPARMS